MTIDPTLLEILACPAPHHAPVVLAEGGASLVCTECGLAFPIRDGIPVMLLDEATLPDEALTPDEPSA